MAAADDNDEASAASAESENSYLALRAAKIARNQARLRELGLITDVPAPKPRKPRPPKKPKAVAPEQIRRSTRASKGKAREYADDHETEAPRLEKRSRSTVKSQAPTPVGVAIISVPTQLDINNIQPTISAREMFIDPSKLLFGETGLLGRPLASTGKAAVMDTSATRAADRRQFTGGQVSFNKYSGVQEWANCFYLWINFGAPNNQVVNQFYDSGRQVVWFGGSAMHDQTPVIQRLQQPHNKGRVILWCREYSSDTRSFGPYVCLGRLELASYNNQTQPLELVWNLMDYNVLVLSKGKDEPVVRMMRRYAGDGAFL